MACEPPSVTVKNTLVDSARPDADPVPRIPTILDPVFASSNAILSPMSAAMLSVPVACAPEDCNVAVIASSPLQLSAV